MADLIDRQAVLGYIERLNGQGTGKGKSLEYLRKYVEHLPTAERVGKWIKPEGMMPPEFHGHYECSCCGGWAMRDWYHPGKVVLTQYCPQCGARMEDSNG